MATGWEVGQRGVSEKKQDGGIEEKAREKEVKVSLKWNKRAGEVARGRKDIVKRMQRQVMGKSKKKMLTVSDQNKRIKTVNNGKGNIFSSNMNEGMLDADSDMQVGSLTDESEKEVEEYEADRMNEMDLEEVIGMNKNMLSTPKINTSQDRCNKDKENKENGERECRENKDKMILKDGIMQYEDKAKEKSIVGNKNHFRFKGDHKESFILGASVKKKKVVKGKVGNAVRIATKTMAISNRIIKIKQLGYNRRDIC